MRFAHVVLILCHGEDSRFAFEIKGARCVLADACENHISISQERTFVRSSFEPSIHRTNVTVIMLARIMLVLLLINGTNTRETMEGGEGETGSNKGTEQYPRMKTGRINRPVTASTTILHGEFN